MTQADRHRGQVLAELGLVRYRLRTRPGALAPTRAAALRVAASGASGTPNQGVEAGIWRQVLAWLGRDADEIDWQNAPDAGVIVLPPLAQWSSPDGKRGLWLALKGQVRERG